MPFTIELDQETAEVVKELAAAQNRSPCEVIRDALAAYVQTGKRPMPRGIGKYRSGQSDVSVKARDLLRDATREGRWP